MLRHRRRDAERGAVAVEMAIVVPVLVLLAFGMLEFGLAFKNKLDMSHAVNQATRHATVLGIEDSADVEILSALEAGLSGQLGAVQRVDIFKASAGGAPLVWDRYQRDPMSGCGWAPCPDPGAGVYGLPADYKPCERDITLNGDGVDTIGVQVQYTHTWISGVLGLPTQTWFETARGTLEPDLFGTASPSC